MPQAIERSLATPMIRPCLPAISGMVIPISRSGFILHERTGRAISRPLAFGAGTEAAGGG